MPPVMAWLIGSIEIAGGFLSGLSLEFPSRPSLVCIIGPRGSGKSTLVEALRYAFSGVTGASKSRQELVQANLGQAVVTVRTVPDPSGSGYVINRRFRQPPSLSATDGRPVSNVDLDRGTFLPLDAYSSLEIESIADESLGEKRRALIDDLHGPDFRNLLHALSNLRRELDANADAIRLATQKALDLTERIEEFGDARAKLQALPPAPKSADTKPLTAALTQQQLNTREAAFLKTSAGALSEMSRALQTALEARVPPAPAMPGARSANAALITSAEAIVQTAVATARKGVNETRAVLGDAAGQLRELESTLIKAHAEHEATLRKLQEENAEAAGVLSERNSAQQAITTIKELEKERAETKQRIGLLRAERATLRGDFLLQREQVAAAREKIADSLQNEAGARVRIRVMRNADNLAYKQMLLQGLHGARVRNHDEILASLLELRPEHLAELIDASAVDELEAQCSFGAERTRRILEAFKENLDPFALEIIEIEDRISIELNVGSETEPNFKDAAELSRGQKCTALLPLLLARRDTPLLVDQPEDNLDNHFIYETVVETILRLKDQRQMFFVTHNANIPVLGEADLVIVMDSDGRKGYVARSGSVDACRTEIIDLLEGGKEAFDLRRQRYEQ
jgi:ABC-type cobalamin/Fe3+-siderophores transport system ATPase subunit